MMGGRGPESGGLRRSAGLPEAAEAAGRDGPSEQPH